jgi:hypothetical protein
MSIDDLLAQLLDEARKINPGVFTVNIEASLFEDGDRFTKFEASVPGEQYVGDTAAELLQELKEAA